MSDRPRETLTEGYVRQLKLSFANLMLMVSEHAGKPGKPKPVVDSINGEIELIEDAARRLGGNRKLPAAFQQAWGTFIRHWKKGNGSWSDCEKDLTDVNRLLQGTDF
jgi:hypothetical protein